MKSWVDEEEGRKGTSVLLNITQVCLCMDMHIDICVDTHTNVCGHICRCVYIHVVHLIAVCGTVNGAECAGNSDTNADPCFYT